MMNKKDFLIALVAVISFPLGAFAAGTEPSTQENFKQLDVNHDGVISQQEAQADKQLTKDWSKADTNKDGQIDESEFSAFEESLPPTNVESD
jgi:Ca2+-binding EF-hand superfamily protein